MGFNRRKMEDERRRVAEKQAAERRATDPQIIEDAERLVAAWNERQEKRMPILFYPQLAPPSPRAIGICGCAARRAGRSMRLTCGRSTVIATRP